VTGEHRSAATGSRGAGAHLTRALTVERLQVVSLVHSAVYTSLLLCAFVFSHPEPATFVLGLSHGVLWIAMSVACLVATRLRVLPLRAAAAVAVLGGIGPFFGSFELTRERLSRRCRQVAQVE
jgi:hypothetical protein